MFVMFCRFVILAGPAKYINDHIMPCCGLVCIIYVFICHMYLYIFTCSSEENPLQHETVEFGACWVYDLLLEVDRSIFGLSKEL